MRLTATARYEATKRLLAACVTGDLEHVKWAIEDDADVNSSGGRSIQLAIAAGHLAVVRALIEYGGAQLPPTFDDLHSKGSVLSTYLESRSAEITAYLRFVEAFERHGLPRQQLSQAFDTQLAREFVLTSPQVTTELLRALLDVTPPSRSTKVTSRL